MGIREALRRRQSLTGIIAGVMIVGSAVAILLQAGVLTPEGPPQAFFSNDDGQTFFLDDNTKLPPFDRDGKPAYRAHMFECGGQRVVGYMSRYTPEALAALQEANKYRGTGRPPPNVARLATIGTTGLQVKKPGDPKWVSQGDVRRATKIRVFRCPDGTTPTEVEP